jgi:hypothetical protein
MGVGGGCWSSYVPIVQNQATPGDQHGWHVSPTKAYPGRQERHIMPVWPVAHENLPVSLHRHANGVPHLNSFVSWVMGCRHTHTYTYTHTDIRCLFTQASTT